MKVYGGCFDGTTRNIVAVQTKKAAAAAFGVTPYALNEWAGETRNEHELTVALSEPGVPFSAPESGQLEKAFVRGLHRYRRGRAWPPEATPANSVGTPKA